MTKKISALVFFNEAATAVEIYHVDEKKRVEGNP